MPYKKRNRRIIQHGGTIIKVIKDDKRIELETPFSNSKILLDNLSSIDCISRTSFGSYVFVGTLKEKPSVLLERQPPSSPPYVTDVCFKVMFVGQREGRISEVNKEVVTEVMADTEVNTQHEMYNELLRKRNEGQLEVVIPDAFGSCILTPDEFNHWSTQSFIDNSLPMNIGVIHDILQISRKNNLNVYVAFIDYLHGFVTFTETREHVNVLPNIGASILELFMKTGCFSLDMHRNNIMIAKDKVKIIDFGKVVCLARDRTYVTQMFEGYVKYEVASSNENTLKSLDAAHFKGTKHVKLTDGDTLIVVRDKIIGNFVTYCSELPGRLEDWAEIPHDDKAIFVFDLLTFIGFVDCLNCHLTAAVMKFGRLLNLLLQTGRGENFPINDVISIRGKVFGNREIITTHPIIPKIVKLLDQIFPSKESKDGGNKRRVTKKRRRVLRRKSGVSRRKH